MNWLIDTHRLSPFKNKVNAKNIFGDKRQQA
jgi:hypothetical protein